MRLIRSASLINYANLAREAGLDPVAVLREAGLPPEALDHPELWVPTLKVREVMTASARLSGWEDFGLRLAETRQFWVLGPLSLAVREQPTLREAITLLIRHMHLHAEALHAWLDEDEHGASVQMNMSGSSDARQSTELSMGMLSRFLNSALPEGWQPLAVCFTHSAPADTSTAHRVLGPNVHYGADFNGMVLRLADLDLPMANCTRLDAYTSQYLRWLTETRGHSTADQVRQLILALLPSGRCTQTRIARHLQCDERTLHRRLEREGTRYTELLNQMRRDLVQRYLAGAPRRQTDLALLLGFSGSTVFSRWFRQQFGNTPQAEGERLRASNAEAELERLR